MATVLQPWQILVAALAGWISRQQDAAIEYLREENRVAERNADQTAEVQGTLRQSLCRQ